MIIHKNTIKALSHVTAEDGRYCLEAIKVEATGCAVATNGHVLLHAPASAAEAQDYPSQPEGLTQTIDTVDAAVDGVIPIDVLTAAAKTPGRRPLIPILDHVVITPSTNGIRVTSADGNGVVSDALTHAPEKTFPEWTKVMPRGTVTMRVSLGQDVLLSIAKAAKALGSKGVCFEFREQPTNDTDYADPIGLVLQSDYTSTDVTGVVMPRRPPKE